jgi:hypothetical protein
MEADMAQDRDMAVAHIVGALIAKGFTDETDGCDLRFDEGDIQLVDTHGHRMSLGAVIALVRRSLE